MIPAINKFFGEQHARHRGKLVWSDRTLYPIKIPKVTSDRLIDKTDIESFMYIAGEPWLAFFDLKNKKDIEHYNWVRERAINNWFSITHQEYHWDEKSKKMLTYLEWVQYYTFLKPRKDL